MHKSQVSSNLLYHFTNNVDILVSILENGFWPSTAIEDISFMMPNNPNPLMGIPMVCFTDIPIELANEHRKEYGKFGLGLKKQWGISKNMVLGIDEYLPDDRKNKDLEFLAFRKFYQRIYKGTGSEYKKWVDKIKVDWNSLDSRIRQDYMKRISYGDIDEDRSLRFHKLFIFGHSLDVTDKDVLIDFILNDNVYTKIYYPNKKELAKKITNLVKIIGQDELIKRTGGSTKTIEFVSQYD